VNLKFKNKKTQDQGTLDSILDHVYKVWLMRPKIFIRPSAEHMETSQRSP
jgi:hypothetical protein